MPSYIYRFINGPERTRSFTWTISASCDPGIVLEGSCSAYGAGVDFTIFNVEEGDIPDIPGFPPTSGMFITVRGITYPITDGEGEFTVSVPTQERTDALIGAGPVGVRVYEKATDGTSAVLTIGGQTIDLSSLFTALSGVDPGIAAKAQIQNAANGSGSLSITEPAMMPWIAEEGVITQTTSGTLSATGGGSTWSGSWSITEASGIGVSISGTWELLQGTSPVPYPPYWGYWAALSSWRRTAYAESHTSPDRIGSYNLLASAVDAPSTEEFEALLLPKNTRHAFTGSGSVDYRLRYRRRWIGGQKETTTGQVNQTQTNHVSESGAVGARYKRVGESDALLTVLPLKLWRWDALALSHDSTTLVDACSSLTPTGTFAATWSAEAGGTVTVAGGAVSISGSSGKRLRRIANGTSNAASERFHGHTRLRLRLRCDQPPHTIRVVAGPGIWAPGGYVAKYWDVVTGAANTWTDIYIEHAGEHNGLPISRSNSVWESGIMSGEAQGWHFLNISGASLTLESLGAGTYDVDLVELDDAIATTGILDTPKVHALQQWVGATGNTSARVLVATCAGTQTLDLLANVIDGSLLGVVATMAIPLGGQCLPGWAMADSSPASGEPVASTITDFGPWGGITSMLTYSDYGDRTCSDLPAAWIASGLLWDGSWAHTFGDGALDVGTIEAQWNVATMDWQWPEAVDSLPGAGDLGLGAVVGGSVWGRALSGPPAPGAHRTALSGDVEATGLGVPTSDTDGIDPDTGFYSVASYGQAGFTRFGATNTVQVTATGSSQAPLPTAAVELSVGRRRLVLTEEDGGDAEGCVSLAQSFTGRLARASTLASGNIQIEARGQAGGVWEPVDTGVVGDCPRLAWDVPGQEGGLLMAYSASGLKTRASPDEGRTWTSVTTVSANGEHITLAVSQSGVRHFFWYDGGTIKRRSYDPQMQEIIAAGNVVASGAADDCFGAVCLMDGSLLLSYRTTGGALAAVTSTDGGVTFS